MQSLLDKRLQRLNRIKLVLIVVELVFLLLPGMYLPLPDGTPTIVWVLVLGLFLITAVACFLVSMRIDKLKYQASGHRL